MLRVKQILKEKNMTMVELAEKLGIHRVTLHQTIKGNPTLETLKNIANALDVELVELFKDNRLKQNSFTCPNCGKELVLKLKDEPNTH